MNYGQHFSTKSTPQSQPIHGKQMAENSAGGYSFELDKWKRFDRFLILGAEGGTYYVSEQKLTQDNAKNVIACIKEDAERAVLKIANVSLSGIAPKNDPAIFALALVCTFADSKQKHHAYAAIHKVCRTGTHLFQFCQAIQDLRGWSRGLKTGVSNFYNSKEADKLALQIVKYRQRNGWTHRDVLRLCHANGVSTDHDTIFRYAVGKELKTNQELPELIQAFEAVQHMPKPDVKFIVENNLPRECLPTEWLNSKDVWAALLENMPITALIRNLGKMSAVGLLTSNFDESVKKVVKMILDENALRMGRVHPLSVLLALTTYVVGRGVKGSLTWHPVTEIAEALNEAFYKCFRNVPPTRKNFLLALDVSGSMDGSVIANTHITAREASAAMALVTMRTESHELVAFTNGLTRLNFPSSILLSEIVKQTRAMPFGGTDCSLPFFFATKYNLPIDVFVTYTDNETWAGGTHPCQALNAYRNKSGRNAKSIVVGMTSNPFSIADPSDANSLDVVGMDSSVPEVMAQFIKE